MKKQLLLATGLCFALTFPALGQEQNQTTISNDTIIFMPDQDMRVILSGDNLKQLAGYARIDSVINMLIADVNQASAKADYPSEARTTHYFITAGGKRRLKSEGVDYLEPEVNVEAEKRSLELNLPAYRFIIYDLQENYQVDIYLKDPARLPELGKIKLNDALQVIVADKKVLRNNYRVDLAKNDNNWTLNEKARLRSDAIEISPSFGLGLIGNSWSPYVGADLYLSITNKYGKHAYKFGLTYGGYAFTGNSSFDLSEINYVSTYSVKVLANVYPGLDKARWFGLGFGRMKSSLPTSFNNKYKFSILSEGFGPLNMSFDTYLLGKKESFYGLTMTFAF